MRELMMYVHLYRLPMFSAVFILFIFINICTYLSHEVLPPTVRLQTLVPFDEDLVDAPQGAGDEEVGHDLQLGALNVNLHHDLR